ncbi:MAG: AMP-binding protein [Flavobacteriales bacterium]|nr:AMP-binding protein [Flavobacteriales bacterium]
MICHSFPLADSEIESDLLQLINEWNLNESISISTSGSTGKPAEIKLKKRLIEWSATATKKALNLAEEKTLICISTNKIGGRMMLYRSFLFQWPFCIIEPMADPLKAIAMNHDFTFVSLVPYQLSTILENESSVEKLKQFKTVLIGGAAIPEKLEAQIVQITHSCKTTFFHSYGMTETASHIAIRNIGEDGFKILSGVHCSTNENSQLMISIPEADIQIITNDLVKLHDGRIYLNGRVDEVINSGGVKLNIKDLETRLEKWHVENNINLRFFLWKQSDEKLGERLIFVGLNRDKSNCKKESFLIFDKFEIPKNTYWVNDFEMTESGKIDKRRTVEKLVEIRG